MKSAARWSGRWATVIGLFLTVTLEARPGAAEPVACQRAGVREAARFAQAAMGALARCEERKIKGTVAAATGCASDGETLAAIARAEHKLRGALAKACGGGNRACDPGDTGADADDSLATIGWDHGRCPDLGTSGCTAPITDCDDVAACLACVARAAVGEASTLYHGSLEPSLPGSPLSRCQIAIVKEGARFFTAKTRALGKCEDRLLRHAIAGPCPAGDPATTEAIARAEVKKQARICKACGGTNGACGGGDDLAPGDIGFPPTCPAVTLPGGSGCSGPVDTLADLVSCVDCVTEFGADCLDFLGVPALKAYPPECQPPPTPTPTPTATVTPTPTLTPSATPTPPAGESAITCERTIVKESARYARARVAALGKCEDAKRRGRLEASTDCPTEAKTAARLAKASGRLSEQVPRACGGADRSCDPADTGGDADLALPLIGWGLSACPDFEDGGCDGTLGDCDELGECVRCVAAAAVDQGLAFAYPDVAAAPDTGIAKCQLALGREVGLLLAARSLALQKCADAVLRGRAIGTCPDPGDGKAQRAIVKAEERAMAAICKACGGGDRLCGGGDDLAPSALGFPSECPPARVPGRSFCGGAVSDLTSLVGCLACLADFKSDCVDRIAVPGLRGYPQECAGVTGTPQPTPTATPSGGAVCGNGVVESGESCDDGNTANCDSCPADCRTPPDGCPSTARHPQKVTLRAPAEASLSGALVCLSYPTASVALPGTGQVSGRISGFSGLAAVNDFNNAAQVALVVSGSAPELSFTLSFDLCSGASAPPPADFACVVKSASDEGSPIEPPSLVECTPVTSP